MDTAKLRKFAQTARKMLMEQVSSKLAAVLRSDAIERRESSGAIAKLENDIKKSSEEIIIEKVAYMWFNRLCAFRYTDVNDYNRIRIISPLAGFSQPEVLAEAKAGHFGDIENLINQRRFDGLLNGTVPSDNPQQEAYRLLFVAYCNHFNKLMPYLFEEVKDYTELLLPDDLLSASSIVTQTCEAMTEDACENVEVLGWLYQFYISEKKDDVFAKLKKNVKITPENIPAATQLFTPDWIVRYLVDNSLGRLWMLNNPQSKLIDQMQYYIQGEQEETDFLKISSVEEIKVCDPACGSGHMLVYAFDLLYAMYEEEGYNSTEIPGLILSKNLYGIELDERAGELAAFALSMKAREKYRRFFRKVVQPNVCVLENIEFENDALAEFKIDNLNLLNDLHLFSSADNFGSLLTPQSNEAELDEAIAHYTTEEYKDKAAGLFDYTNYQKIFKALEQAKYLSNRYHVVVANPPYMGGKGMNAELSVFAKKNYPASKSDLFSMFIERNLQLAINKGMTGMVTMQSWMFLSSFEKLRDKILNSNTILSMAHLGPRGFDSIGGEVVQTTAFVIENGHKQEFKGDYLRLINGKNEAEKQADFQANRINGDLKFSASAEDFGKIPGAPIAYWVSENVRNIFDDKFIENITISDGQTKTGNNDKYLRLLWEVSKSKIGKSQKWVKHPKGGPFRRWYGNLDCVIDWSETSRLHYRKDHVARILPEYLWWKKAFCWTLITSGSQSFRLINDDEIFNLAAPTLFPKNETDLNFLLSLVNTPISTYMANLMNPTLNMNVGEIRSIPIVIVEKELVDELSNKLISLSKYDWDSYENSWDFELLPLLDLEYRKASLQDTYLSLREEWIARTLEMQKLEEENNRIFIEAYGLEDELTPEVPINEITLTCNPHYRYKGDKSNDELEALLMQDTIKEFISYAVGCMFGRYSIDKTGLILANQGEALEDYLKQIPEPSFMPDDDNVIPLMAIDWFEDDIVNRFKEFLKVTFGKEHFETNLEFIENALGKNGKKKPIREYFLKNFYTDHVKMYKKRPIYWMFSSPNGAFNALIYMHRYNTDTISTVLNEYLREFNSKLTAHLRNREQQENISEGAARIKIQKEIALIKKQLAEITEYERTMFELISAGQDKLAIELDDGVKVNYKKFNKVLKKIAGLS